jgi:hypothetical protein
VKCATLPLLLAFLPYAGCGALLGDLGTSTADGGAADVTAATLDAPSGQDVSPGDDAPSTRDDAASADAAAETAPDAPTSVPRDGLVGEWLFDGNAMDTSGQQHDGTNNGALPAPDRAGNPQGAFHFDGASNMVEIADAPELRLTGDMAISAWIRPEGYGPGLGVISKYQSFATSGYALRLGYASPFAYLDFDGTPAVDASAPPTVLVLGQWQHVVVVVRSGNVEMYVNAVVVANGPPGFAALPTTDPLRIGVDYTTRFFKGSIDEVRLYGRALDLAEIQSLYDAK